MYGLPNDDPQGLQHVRALNVLMYGRVRVRPLQAAGSIEPQTKVIFGFAPTGRPSSWYL